MSRKDLKTVELNAHHNEMVLKYLRFAILNRKRQVKDMEGIFEEYKDTRFPARIVCSLADEVATLLDNLGATLKADMYRNLQIISNSNGILLKQLFAQAEDNIVNLTVDTSILEDEFLLSMVQKLEDDAESQPARSTALLETSSMSSLPPKLPTLREEKKAEELLLSNAAMKKRQLELEEEVSKLKTEMKNKESTLQSQIEILSEQLKQSQAACALAASAPASKKDDDVESGGDLAGLHRRIRELELEVSLRTKEALDLDAQLARRVNEAPQFKQLSDLLKRKNSKLKTYREKLVEFGWSEDDGEDED